MVKVEITSKISPENVAWSDWGNYSYGKFLSMFSTSEELMSIQIEGAPDALESLLNDQGIGAEHSLGNAVAEFAKTVVPHRNEIFGQGNTFSPYRESRPGFQPSIPSRAPDVFKPILEGDTEKGHAIIAAFNQDTDVELDDLFTEGVLARTIGNTEAHALTIVNRFPAYVRVMDKKLEQLLKKIGFETPSHIKPTKLTSIPFGMNLVSFPFEYHESLSTMPIYTLYSTMKAAQRGLKKTFSITNTFFHNVFFNIEPLAGGTIPRIHMQTYIRTRGHPKETYEFPLEAKISSRDFEEKEISKLGIENRSWFAYSPSVKSGKYDLKLELKQETEKDFSDLNKLELWDLAEIMIYLSRGLDETLQSTDKKTGEKKIIKERNVLFFPKGVVVRPFGVEGGQERSSNEKIYGKSPEIFAKDFMKTMRETYFSRKTHYTMPKDYRGIEEFQRIVNENSPIYKRSA